MEGKESSYNNNEDSNQEESQQLDVNLDNDPQIT
jgi:hypothetical protein